MAFCVVLITVKLMLVIPGLSLDHQDFHPGSNKEHSSSPLHPVKILEGIVHPKDCSGDVTCCETGAQYQENSPPDDSLPHISISDVCSIHEDSGHMESSTCDPLPDSEQCRLISVYNSAYFGSVPRARRAEDISQHPAAAVERKPTDHTTTVMLLGDLETSVYVALIVFLFRAKRRNITVEDGPASSAKGSESVEKVLHGSCRMFNMYWGDNFNILSLLSFPEVPSMKSWISRVGDAYSSFKGSCYDWIFAPRFDYLDGFRNFSFQPTFELEMPRLASYRQVPPEYLQVSHPSFIQLSGSGFFYPGQGGRVRCEGCNIERVFGDFTSSSDPADAHHHGEGCRFISNDERHREQASTTHGHTTEQSLGVSDTQQHQGNDVNYPGPSPPGHEQENEYEEEAEGHSHSEDETTEVRSLPSVGTEQASVGGDSINTNVTTETPLPQCPRQTNGPASQQDGHPRQRPESGATTGQQGMVPTCVSGQERQTNHLFFDEFGSEHANTFSKVPPLQSEARGKCKKNPGHFGFLTLDNLKPENLPDELRHPDVLTFLRIFAQLVVRVVVKDTSPDRPNDDPVKAAVKARRCGTGSTFVQQNESLGELVPQPDKPGKFQMARKYLNALLGDKHEVILVETNRHLVFDDREASRTTVEFLFDRPDRKGVVKVKAVSVIHSSTPGDTRSLLVCKTSDLSLVQLLDEKRRKLMELAETLPQRAKDALTGKVIVIAHPHGGEKVLTCGRSVQVKYVMTSQETEGRTVAKLTRISNHNQVPVDVSSVRKALLYTADTCEGSSGAPVIAFRQVEVGADGHRKLGLDIWMHNGVERSSGLNASVMKVCTSDDLLQRASSGPTGQSNGQLNSTANSLADEDSLGNRPINCPVFRVSCYPSQPAYIAYQKRLESFREWTYHQIHRPEDLAYAGFYYAGYADCVRCFQCGLGLKSWKPGDNVYEEHKRHRPNCQFLQLQISTQRHFSLQPPAQGGADAGHFTLPIHTVTHDNNDVTRRKTPTANTTGRQQTTATSAPTGVKQIQELLAPSNFMPVIPEITVNFATVDYSGRQAPLQGAGSNSNSGSQSNDDSGKPMVVRVLERENKVLQNRFLCKVCYKQPCKDLFLPCGELYACADCSKLLTHCPSCGKEIKATVTTYLT